MDTEAVLNILLSLVNQYAQSVITSKLITVLKVHLMLGKLGLSKTTIAIIIMLM